MLLPRPHFGGETQHFSSSLREEGRRSPQPPPVTSPRAGLQGREQPGSLPRRGPGPALPCPAAGSRPRAPPRALRCSPALPGSARPCPPPSTRPPAAAHASPLPPPPPPPPGGRCPPGWDGGHRGAGAQTLHLLPLPAAFPPLLPAGEWCRRLAPQRPPSSFPHGRAVPSPRLFPLPRPGGGASPASSRRGEAGGRRRRAGRPAGPSGVLSPPPPPVAAAAASAILGPWRCRRRRVRLSLMAPSRPAPPGTAPQAAGQPLPPRRSLPWPAGKVGF